MGIKKKYYEKAVAIWSRFGNIDIPRLEDLPGVKVYKSYGGRVVSFDLPDEYIDNYHPLWKMERDIVQKVLTGETSELEIPRFIHSKWGWHNKIDLHENLTHFNFSKTEHSTTALDVLSRA